VWPGSSLQGIQALKDVRWEDFECSYVDGIDLGWCEDGWSHGDMGNDNLE